VPKVVDAYNGWIIAENCFRIISRFMGKESEARGRGAHRRR
jgi:hypothetical protein